MIIPKLNSALAYGGDYNPEQWPESVWHEDVKLMREAGINLVTLGVFSWGKLQPTEECYDFAWLDRVMDLLGANGIFVDLATATASPPPWMSHRYPDVVAIDANGAAYSPGSRQHYSPCSPTYRRLAAALVTRLAERYKQHPALAAWHINNEYGNHVAECHGPAATAAFRAWLARRYVTIERVNETWGTAFWSQQYTTWEEILTPRRTPTFANPTQQLDYKRFMSDAVLELFTMERDLVRTTTPEVPVTTNYMGFHKPMNYRKWSAEMDFVSWDSYPDPLPGRDGAAMAAAGHDLMRSMKKDRPFLLMEQSVSSVTWRNINGAKTPGLMKLWSWQALARGADGVLFFQWRASKQGAEKFLGGIVPHIPADKSRMYAQVSAMGAELKQLAPIVGSRMRARVAIAFDWEAWWALEFDSKPARIDYTARVLQIHRYFFERNIAVDFVHPDEDLRAYRLVVAPTLYLLTKASAENLTRFVKTGGTLVTTYFSGIVDEHEQVVPGGYPSYLRAVLGMWVEEWHPLGAGLGNAIHFSGKAGQSPCHTWSELIHLEGAKALASFTQDDLAGRPAVTSHRYGQGHAYYISTGLESPVLATLLDRVCRQAKVRAVLRTPAGVEVTLREGATGNFIFLLNHKMRPTRIALGPKRGRDLLTGKKAAGTITLAPRGAAIIQLA